MVSPFFTYFFLVQYRDQSKFGTQIVVSESRNPGRRREKLSANPAVVRQEIAPGPFDSAKTRRLGLLSVTPANPRQLLVSAAAPAASP